MAVIAIDQGTTSTRALGLAADGAARVFFQLDHEQHYPREGWVEHRAAQLLDNIHRALAAALAAGPVDAVGLANQGESCLAWHADSGEPLSPVIVWQDNRTVTQCEALAAAGAEAETLARAGLPLDPYFSASKLGWLLRELPAVQRAQRAGKLRLGTTDAFFLDRLCGRFVTDLSTASRTSLMNLASGQWDPALCRLFGVPIECLPAIVASSGELGCARVAGRELRFSASLVDQQAALYGIGCRCRGDAKLTVGTGAFALMLGGDTAAAGGGGVLPTVAWQRAGEAPRYALEGGVYSAAAALNWARSLGLFGAYEEIDQFAAEPAIERGLAFVPALAGLGCPHWNPRARATWAGLALEHSGADLLQSVLEGVALRAVEVIEALTERAGRDHAQRPLPIDGGLSRNAYFVQYLANVLGRELRVFATPEFTALGAMALASEAIGAPLAPRIDERRVSPDADHRAHLARFRELVAHSARWAASGEGGRRG